MATKEALLKALDEIKESYDAFYIENKYGEAKTHRKQFDMLAEVKGLSLEGGALCWVMYQYDCYYKHKFEDETGTAFEYIRNLINNENV